MAYSREQRHIQNLIIDIGLNRRMPRKAILSALATGAVETHFRNLAGGDADSQGWRQERKQFYKNPRNLHASINRFYDEWEQDAPHSGPIGPMAQAVQQSAFPGRYQQQAGEARQIFRSRRGSSSRAGGTLTSSRRVQGLDFSAERQQAKIDYLQQRGRPGALLDLGLQLQGLQDVPGGVVTSRSATGGYDPADPRTGDGHPLNHILRSARQWSKANVKYVWGGGHGATAKVGDAVDCSGFVSALIGLKTPLVSGQLMNWGKPGRGHWLTVYASPTHTFVSIRDPKTHKLHFFGTSRMGKNPNGGVTEFHPSASYLKGFTARHPG